MISEPNFDGDFERSMRLPKQHRAGRFHDMIALAEQATKRPATTRSGPGRATDAVVVGTAWVEPQMLEAIQDGLRLSAVSPERRRMIQSNLANAYYSLWRVLGLFHRGRSA